MTLDCNQWRSDLINLIATALREFRGQTDAEMAMLAVDCHPWHGVLVLAFLTHSELKRAPFLSEAAEMAAWKHYDFGANLASWQSAPDVALGMRTAYERAGGSRSGVAEQFLRECAAAVASEPVQDLLSTYRLSEGFRITIPHPDTHEEYYPPK